MGLKRQEKNTAFNPCFGVGVTFVYLGSSHQLLFQGSLSFSRACPLSPSLWHELLAAHFNKVKELIQVENVSLGTWVVRRRVSPLWSAFCCFSSFPLHCLGSRADSASIFLGKPFHSLIPLSRVFLELFQSFPCSVEPESSCHTRLGESQALPSAFVICPIFLRSLIFAEGFSAQGVSRERRFGVAAPK